MSRDGKRTCHDLIEPALRATGWSWYAEVEL